MPASFITVTGNLADDPELRFTPSGHPVASFRIGVTERYRDNAGEWKERETSWFSVQCWRDLAEHVAESLTRGARVTVSGTMRQRTYETKEGEKRYVWDLHAEEVGVSLRYATVKIHKAPRGPAPEDPWADTNGNDTNGTGEAGEARKGPVKARAGDRGTKPATGQTDDPPPF